MSGPHRTRPATTQDDDREDDEYEKKQPEEEGESPTTVHKNTKEETQVPHEVPLGAPLRTSLDNPTTISPQQTRILGVMDSLSGLFPATSNVHLHLPRSSTTIPTNPSLDQMMINTARTLVPYQQTLGASSTSLDLGAGLLDPTMFLGASENRTMFLGARENFFDALPQLQHTLDSLQSSSLGLDLASLRSRRSAAYPFPNPSTSLYNNDRFAIQRAAAQTNALLFQQELSRQLQDRALSATAAFPPTSSAGLESATMNGFSFFPVQTPALPISFTDTSSSALSSAARVAEQALPLSTDQESRIPLVGGPELFPMVLHRALAELELVAGGRTIATFLPDGRSFCIKNQALFTQKVLPLFFPKMKGFASFQRQLNLYDFVRVGGAGVDRGAYYHKLFVRDHPAMSSGMRRTKIKGSRPRVPPNSSSKNEVEHEATDLTSAGEASYEQEAASVSSNDTEDLLDRGKRKTSDASEPEDKGNLD